MIVDSVERKTANVPIVEVVTSEMFIRDKEIMYSCRKKSVNR